MALTSGSSGSSRGPITNTGKGYRPAPSGGARVDNQSTGSGYQGNAGGGSSAPAQQSSSEQSSSQQSSSTPGIIKALSGSGGPLSATPAFGTGPSTPVGQRFASQQARSGGANYQTSRGEVQQVTYQESPKQLPNTGITNALSQRGAFGGSNAFAQASFSPIQQKVVETKVQEGFLGRTATGFGSRAESFAQRSEDYESRRIAAANRREEAKYTVLSGTYGYAAIGTQATSTALRSGDRFAAGIATGAIWEGIGLAAVKKTVTRVAYKATGVGVAGLYGYDVSQRLGTAVKEQRTGAGRLLATGTVMGQSGAEVIGFGTGAKSVRVATGEPITLPGNLRQMISGERQALRTTVRVDVRNFRSKTIPLVSTVEVPVRSWRDTVLLPQPRVRLATEGRSIFTDRSGSVGGRSARARSGKTSKAELRKQTYNTAYDPRVTEFEDFGIVRVRNDALKGEFVKERRVYVDPQGVVKGIQDVGLRTDMPGLKASGTPSNKIRYTRSQMLSGVGKSLELRPGEYVISSASNRKLPASLVPEARRDIPRGFTGDAPWLLSRSNRVVVRDATFTTLGKGEQARIKGIAITRGGPGDERFSKLPTDVYRRLVLPESFTPRMKNEVPIGSPEYRRMKALSRLRELRENQEYKVRFGVPAIRPEFPRQVGRLPYRSTPVRIQDQNFGILAGRATRRDIASIERTRLDMRAEQNYRRALKEFSAERTGTRQRTAVAYRFGSAQTPQQDNMMLYSMDGPPTIPTPRIPPEVPTSPRIGDPPFFPTKTPPPPELPPRIGIPPFVPRTPEVPPIPPEVPPPFVPSLRIPTFGYGGGSSRRDPFSRASFKYVPSFTAGYLNIRGRKQPGYTLSPVSVRPIISSVKRSVRRRRR